MEKKKGLQKRHGVVKRVFSLILAFAMVITMTQFAPGGVTAKADTGTVKVYFELAGSNASEWGLGVWSGATVVEANQDVKMRPESWGAGEQYPTLLTDEGHAGWGYVVLSGVSETTSIAFIKDGETVTKIEPWNAQIVLQELTEAYYDPAAEKWYLDADKRSELTIPEAQDCTVKIHYYNSNNWEKVHVKAVEGGSWTAIEGYPEYNNFPGVELQEENGHPGWYCVEINKKNNTTFNCIFNYGAGKQTKNIVIPLTGRTEYEAWCTGNGDDLSEEEPKNYTDPGSEPETPVVQNVTITMHFQKPATGWDKVNAFITQGEGWTPIDGYGYAGTFPGAEVEADKSNDGWYSFTITMKKDKFNLIFNNGVKENGIQTGNIEFTPTEEKTEKWVTFTTHNQAPDISDKAPTGWVNGTSNPPIKFSYVSPEVDGRKVIFRYKSDTAKKVQLAGAMTGWGDSPIDMKKGEDGIWSVELQLSPGTYQYKFIVDGSWIADPVNDNTVDDGYGGRNPLVVVAGLADGELEAEKGVETELPETLKLYNADGTSSDVKVTYEFKEANSNVTMADGKITVPSTYTGTSFKLTATTEDKKNTSTVTVKVVDKLYTYTIYYYDFNEEHMTKDAAALWIWEVDGAAGKEFAFDGTEILPDGNTWLKATVKVPYLELGAKGKVKSENPDSPVWTWEDSANKIFSNEEKANAVTLYFVYGDGTAYTELPELTPPRDRFVVVEYDRPAGDYTGWNIYSWNTGFGSGTELYSEEINGKHYITVPVADYAVDLNLSFCMRRTEEENAWADKDGGDHFIYVPSDQIVVKARFVQDKGVTEILPYNTGYEMDGENDQIHFYYRDDELFKECKLDTLNGKVQIVINDGTPVNMEYDAKNERFYYDYKGLEARDYSYYYLVDGEKVLDTFNPRTTEDGSASVLTYKVFDAGIAASVLNSTMDYNDNNVLAVEFTGADRQNISTEEIASIKANLSELGFGTIDADPELMKVTIACLYTTSAGEKTIPVEVKDIYGHVYTADVKVTVTERKKAAGEFDWDEAVIYFAVTDRFFDGNTSNNDAYGIGDYNTGEKGGSSYQGGDFAGLTQKLDYLKDLGVNTIWITPIVENITEDQHDPDHDFATYGYHGYWASDFTKLNQHLGTEAEFKALLDAAHSKNMKIMVDVVINHAGYGTEEYFNTILPGDVKMLRDGSNTVSGSDVYAPLSGLPDFVTENAAVRDQLVQWQTDWMDKFDIDYYRVDTVKHVDNTTWSAFKNSLTAVNPDFKMTGEYAGAGYANTAGMLETGRMDALLDFDFNGWALDFVTGKISSIESNLVNRNAAINNTATMSSFMNSHDENGLQYILAYGDTQSNKLDDFYDESKGSVTPKAAYDLMKVAATMMITAKGQPVIYYGEEIGMTGANDWPRQTNRYNFDWAELEKQKSDPNSIFNHYKTMLAIRNAYTDVFARGTRTTIDANDAEGYDVISRSYGGVTLYVGMNIKDTAKEVAIPVNAGRAGSAGAVYTNLYDGKEYTAAADGKVTVTIPAAKDGGTVVLVAKKTTQGEVQGEQENPTQQGWYDGWAGVSPEQKAKLMRESLAQNAAVTAPKTNDNAPIAMVIMLLMTGAVAVAGAVGKKRKLG